MTLSIFLALSGCNKNEIPQEDITHNNEQSDSRNNPNEQSDIPDSSNENAYFLSTNRDFYEKAAWNPDNGQLKQDDALENLTGEYNYLSDYGTGKLIIRKSSDGYDISDYESESSYRFLANSSNIEAIENNRIYIKYPEQVFSDNTVIFNYYILEYSTDEINVYYGKSVPEEAQFLYHATKKTD